MAFASFSAYTVSVATGSKGFGAKTAFVSLALFNTMRNPFRMVPGCISAMSQAIISLQRIDDFLNRNEREPYIKYNKNSIKVTWNDDGKMQSQEIRMCFQNYSVSLRNCTLAWADPTVEEESVALLRNLDIKIPKRSLVAVVGPMGSGKSSLLSALVGDMTLKKGSIEFTCPQDVVLVEHKPWLRNASIRDNILFGSEFKYKLYNRVIEACALKPDLDVLPQGDETIVGENGKTMSGGQKQR